MKLSAELLFLLTCVYQSFGFLHIDLRRSSKRYLPQLYNAIDTTDPLPEGFEIDGALLTRPTKPKQPIPVSSISQLKNLIYQGYRVQDLDVRGDTSRNITDIHPVVLALHRRKDLKVETSFWISTWMRSSIFFLFDRFASFESFDISACSSSNFDILLRNVEDFAHHIGTTASNYLSSPLRRAVLNAMKCRHM